MVHSGEVVDLSAITGHKVDKHSTGGVGDTTTLVLAPLVSACGVPVAKMSGRGLGFTGGTLDKLEAIPGFETELSEAAFVSQVQRVGIAVMAQSASIVPADKKIYALRDVTGTVPSIPLIVSSILSKKIAGGADGIVVDVKVGSGAFMKTEADARLLAHELTAVGESLGRSIACVMTDMDQPLGKAIGNGLEVAQALRVLRGEGDGDLVDVCLALGAKMLVLAEKSADEPEAVRELQAALASGAALERFRQWVAAQGGDPNVADDMALLPRSAHERSVRVDETGYVARLDAEAIGRAAMELGAGRRRAQDVLDPGAGVVCEVRVGEQLDAGDVAFVMYASTEALLDAGEERLRHAVHVSPEPVTPPRLLRDLAARDAGDLT